MHVYPSLSSLKILKIVSRMKSKNVSYHGIVKSYTWSLEGGRTPTFVINDIDLSFPLDTVYLSIRNIVFLTKDEVFREDAKCRKEHKYG